MAKTKVKDMPLEVKQQLDHFVGTPNPWPVRVTKKEAKSIKKLMPYMSVVLDVENAKYYKETKHKRTHIVTIGTKDIPLDIKLQYWKMRLEEEQQRYEELYQKLKGIVEES